MQKDFTKVFRPVVHFQFSYCNFHPCHCITGKQTNFFSVASNNGPIFRYIWWPDLKKDIVFLALPLVFEIQCTAYDEVDLL